MDTSCNRVEKRVNRGNCDGFETRGRPGAPAALPFKVTLGEATVAEYPAMSLYIMLGS